jgi:hypothetical protein
VGLPYTSLRRIATAVLAHADWNSTDRVTSTGTLDRSIVA